MTKRGEPNLPVYENEPDSVFRAVSRHKSRLKFVLKTKNDPIFLQDWLEHHGRIAGFGNLIVADNMSNDPDVFRIYEKYCHDVFIFRFRGHQNAIHRESAFPALYAALYDSAAFFHIIDTDERIVVLEDDRVIGGEGFLDALADSFGEGIILGTFFNNRRGRQDTFVVNERQLVGPLWAGKSLFSSEARRTMPASASINHNDEIPDAEDILRAVRRTRIGVLHLTMANYVQRMRANREKLVSQKLVDPDAAFEEIAGMQLDDIYSRHLVEQIRTCLGQLAEPDDDPGDSLGRHHFRIGPAGSLAFGSGIARQSYRKVVNEPAAILFCVEGRRVLQERVSRRMARRPSR